jgi:hypothetical protein
VEEALTPQDEAESQGGADIGTGLSAEHLRAFAQTLARILVSRALVELRGPDD